MAGSDGAPKVLLSAVRSEMSCGGGVAFRLEGYLVGHVLAGECDGERGAYALRTVLFAHGQEIGGPLFDVYVGLDRKSYEVEDPWVMEFQHPTRLGC